MGELNAQQPRLFVSSANKAEGSAEVEAAQHHLQVPRGWLSRLEIKEQSEELAEGEMREKESESARAWDPEAICGLQSYQSGWVYRPDELVATRKAGKMARPTRP